MLDKTYIRAIYTPDKWDEAKGFLPDPDNAVSVTIVTFLDRDSIAVFIDFDGNLRSGYLRQFSSCVFVTL